MQGFMGTLFQAIDLLVVVVGFSLIIILHELGHFLAARWAKVRVLAFAVGFGPALVSYRKGLGFRRGSSAAEFDRLPAKSGVSTTEYRFNALPFGGYVKMLGQDDADVRSQSTEPDSYGMAPVWKRMIIISAGVVMNLLLAASLFVAVFMLGLRVDPPRIGDVLPGSPAAMATALNAKELGITEPGLRPGDLVVSIDGSKPAAFNDVATAAIMASRGRSLDVAVRRPGIESLVQFRIEPRTDPATRTLQLGIYQDGSNQLDAEAARQQPAAFSSLLERSGLSGVTPDMKLVRAGGQPATVLSDAARAAQQSQGRPVEFVFSDGTATVTKSIRPRPQLQTSVLRRDSDTTIGVQHVVGLVPVMQIEDVTAEASKSGLRAGDVMARVGDLEWPSYHDAVLQIRTRKGKTTRVAVARADGPGGAWTVRDLGELAVSREGTLGVYTREPVKSSARLASWPGGEGKAASGSIPGVPIGTRILAVNGTPVADFGDLRVALQQATSRGGAEEGSGGAGGGPGGGDGAVELTIERPALSEGAEPRTDEVRWPVPPDQAAALRGLGWENPLPSALFLPDEMILKASGPVEALGMGLDRTRSAMLSTYVTFARLFQGTVKVEHLKGPVGIVHLGTQVAKKGYIWLMFLLALISVNLAVINFLPIPVADGGHFVFLLYEQLTGKPPSIAVQNAAALAGLALIAGLFLVVTYNDIRNLF